MNYRFTLEAKTDLFSAVQYYESQDHERRMHEYREHERYERGHEYR